jgi:hypothetical protein
MTDSEAQSLRREITARERGRGTKYPIALRLRAGEWIRQQVAAGAPLRTAAERIGVERETAARWLRRRRRERSPLPTAPMTPVELADEPSGDRRVVVISPSGFRVNGLTLDEAATLLRVLG